jgi:hypothetical protein
MRHEREGWDEGALPLVLCAGSVGEMLTRRIVWDAFYPIILTLMNKISVSTEITAE